jgi:hypothetical protein
MSGTGNEATADREPGRAVPDDDGPEYSDIDGGFGPQPAPPTAFESLVNSFLDAGPDAAGHVVRSAQELLLAAQTIVDAAQHAVEEQQNLRRARNEDAKPAAADGPEPGATVHHLDVSE